MDKKIEQEFSDLPQPAKDFLMSDQHKKNCKEIFDKAGGPLTRATVAKIRESFTAFVMPKVSDEVRGKLAGGKLSDEQKDAVWSKMSGGAETIDLPAFIKLTSGIYTHALAQGVNLDNLRQYSDEWRGSFS
eukprot:CAMPEP_0206186190 /NCGR_PEP_ID=MMETSP0166-20121206/2265_1 /ASSEMBLY_ACC=CAM_ASM_000260 /TAXON_ID=95228 /ORGANISM="Vannella robusta, Strain DIVA3 518/3/11/1/6" /LENGTH=130 /DNA_ID=CAMNT_0053601547 /DNA_START=257 /DNA_END=645 /DNA_ORIENTATION=+